MAGAAEPQRVTWLPPAGLKCSQVRGSQRLGGGCSLKQEQHRHKRDRQGAGRERGRDRGKEGCRSRARTRTGTQQGQDGQERGRTGLQLLQEI